MYNPQKIEELQTKIQNVFHKWQIYNSEYTLETQIEKNPELLNNESVRISLLNAGPKSITFNTKTGWEKYQMITIGNEFPKFGPFLEEIKPFYEELASQTQLFEGSPKSYFKIMSFDDVTLIGLQPEIIDLGIN